MTTPSDKTRVTLDALQAKWNESLDTRFAAFSQTFQALLPQASGPQEVPLMVPMAQGLLAPIEKAIPKIGGVELGSIGIGGITGLILGEVIDGFVPPDDEEGNTNMANILAKSAGAFIVATQGKRLMSPTAANFAAGILVIQVLRDVLPLDQWIDKLVGWVRPKNEAAQECGSPAHTNGHFAEALASPARTNGHFAEASIYNQPSVGGVPRRAGALSLFG